MKMSGDLAAQKYIESHFPDCDVALLAGSSARGELTEHSDLDMVIVDETQSSPFRQCVFCFDWDIELFVFTNISLSLAFETSRLEGIPTIPRMCVDGHIIKDNGSAKDIQLVAKDYMEKGPVKWTEEQQNYQRFIITDLLQDLNSSIHKEEKLFVAHKLFDFASEYVLRVNEHWIGQGKWMYRSLSEFDKSFSDEFIDAYQLFMRTGDDVPFTAFIDSMLEPYGGRLFDGYKESLF
ncbi:putative nucleotidyltransferase [Virgibacillus natechei]|uniref:Nucleotidyltransferase n=1 Tax=Virgibacillus natechei TaxID=1216297 RepID=A0ABS4IDW8_9BACI|nr:nucleotidyltransferase domain-containing protein [Virgibacillus natechei]MBP1969138.1 putative nucleotidyltransferase [Virgibacillus natechei]UZD14400.1 nucleotidyltransferase domain-containing protein [Virgibacillus natechei]